MFRVKLEFHSESLPEIRAAFKQLSDRFDEMAESGVVVDTISDLMSRIADVIPGTLEIAMPCSATLPNGRKCGKYTTKQVEDGSPVCGIHHPNRKRRERGWY